MKDELSVLELIALMLTVHDMITTLFYYLGLPMTVSDCLGHIQMAQQVGVGQGYGRVFGDSPRRLLATLINHNR